MTATASPPGAAVVVVLVLSWLLSSAELMREMTGRDPRAALAILCSDTAVFRVIAGKRHPAPGLLLMQTRHNRANLVFRSVGNNVLRQPPAAFERISFDFVDAL